MPVLPEALSERVLRTIFTEGYRSRHVYKKFLHLFKFGLVVLGRSESPNEEGRRDGSLPRSFLAFEAIFRYVCLSGVGMLNLSRMDTHKTVISERESRQKAVVRITVVGSVVNLVLVLLKFAAGILGRSAAMVADAVHSLSDFVTDVIVLVFIRLSSKPRDADHKYGHGKYETLATAIIGLVLCFVGLKLMWDGGSKVYGFFVLGEDFAGPGYVALAAALVSIVAKEILYRYTVLVGRRENSRSVVANAWHHRSDAFSSMGTAVGIGGAVLLGPGWAVLDPIAAVAVSFFIVKVALGLLLPAVNELMEKSLPESIESDILSMVKAVPGVYDPHNLRTRCIGNNYAIEVHVRVDGAMQVGDAHEITKTIESRLRECYGEDTHVNIHVKPIK